MSRLACGHLITYSPTHFAGVILFLHAPNLGIAQSVPQPPWVVGSAVATKGPKGLNGFCILLKRPAQL